METATIEEIRLILKYIAKGYKVPDIIKDEIFNTAVREIEEKELVVMIKRDPDIHRGRLQGRYVKMLKEGNSMDMHPATVAPFGADFDGDAMAIYVPMSKEAQNEVKSKMITAVDVSSFNDTNFEMSKEMLTGIYTMTYEEKKSFPKQIKTLDEARTLDLGQPIVINFRGKQKTTAGRLIFNSALPEWFEFVNYPVRKKELKDILEQIVSKDRKEFVATTDRLMDMSFYYATIHPKSFALDMMELSPKLLQLKRDLAKEKDVGKQSNIVAEMEKELIRHLEKNHPDLYLQIASGAAKGGGQIRQLMVCKGLVADPQGNVLPPILSSISDGYDPQEYFNAAAGSRKGIIDRAINTAAGGYMGRKFIYITGNVRLNSKTRDCLTKQGLDIKLTPELYKKLEGRFVISGRDITPITKEMVGTKITLRSPIFCKTADICPTCYGELYKQVGSTNIGVVAAQQMNFSERIMKSSVGFIVKKVNNTNILLTLDDAWEHTEWSDD